MIYFSNKQNGFSLVETLVAISILLIVIVGPMSISVRTAKSASFASEQIQAFFLAQEGLELAQKARDEYFLRYFNNGQILNPWQAFRTDGIYANCLSASGCGLVWDYNNYEDLLGPVSCATAYNCLLYLSVASSERSMFTHIAGRTITPNSFTATPFTRRIYFTVTPGLEAVQVRSVVTWRTGSVVAEQKVEVDTYLYNVYDTP